MIRFTPVTKGMLPLTDGEQETSDRNMAMEFLRNIERPDLEWLWPTVAGMDEMENSRILDIIKQWIQLLRDVGLWVTGCREVEVFNADRREELQLLTGRWKIPEIVSAIRIAEDTRRHLQRNANSRLMLESLLIRSADLYWGGNVNADHRGSPV